MIPKVLLDTDILSMIMRKNDSVVRSARNYLSIYKKFTFSIITKYEILRGLKAKKAMQQIIAFNLLCQYSEVLPINNEVILKAADIYAELKGRGMLINDADILIAASALENELIMVTNNEAHFKRIRELVVKNWAKK